MTSLQEKMRDLFGPGHRQIAQILPGLYLSDIMCASDDALLSYAGFTHVISVLSAPIPWLGPSSQSSSCRVMNIRCDDTSEDDILKHFPSTNQFITEAFREKGKVLVHCLAGVSRSPTVVAAYLIWAAGMRRDEALDLLRERRGVVEPNPGFIEQLGVYESMVRSRGRTAATTHDPYTHAISCK